MKRYFFILWGIGLLAWTSGCNSEMDSGSADPLQYPYHAPPEKADRITRCYRQLKNGMTQPEVVKLMGEPEEKNQLYKSAAEFEQRKASGEIWVYLLQRLQPYGGITERKEQAVRLEFDKQQKLQRIDTVGIIGIGAVKSSPKRKTGFPGAAY